MIVVENLSLRVGTFALDGISLEIPSGAYGVLMGRTGAGKSTLLEAICGLRTVAGGRILLDGVDVTHAKPALRGVGYVPQDGALFPTLNVGDQLAFSLTLRKWTTQRIEARVLELADLLGIRGLLQRFPEGLSGGERQRVALGRALAYRPAILCLDEPLSALDEETREGARNLLKEVQRIEGVTMLHVTHSRQEAELLADVLLEFDRHQLRARNLTNPSDRSARAQRNHAASASSDEASAAPTTERAGR